MQEEADAKVQLAREDLSNDYKDKLTKQEERFTTKRKELQDRINALEKEEKRLTTRFESAREAQTRAERRVTDLEKDLATSSSKLRRSWASWRRRGATRSTGGTCRASASRCSKAWCSERAPSRVICC